MVEAIIALGSNLGDRLDYLRTAVAGLADVGRVRRVSSLYETEPVGGPAQGRYLNAVVSIETDLDPPAVLDGLRAVERRADRVRRERWGPRTLDLDLITYGDVIVDEPGLTVPHPRAQDRRFVLAPLVEVAPGAVLADGRTAEEALRSVPTGGVTRWSGDWVDDLPGMGAEAGVWVAGQVILIALWAVATRAGIDAHLSAISEFGIAVTVAGLAIGVAAIVAFGGRVTVSPQPLRGRPLIDRGIYRLIRHPMYTAVVATLAGTSIALEALRGLAVAGLLGLFFLLKARREERILAICVRGYSDYAARVRTRFVPFVF